MSERDFNGRVNGIHLKKLKTNEIDMDSKCYRAVACPFLMIIQESWSMKTKCFGNKLAEQLTLQCF